MATELNSIRDFVHEKIRKAAKENWQPVPTIDDSFNLVESGLFDSLGFVGLLSAVEKEFNFTIDPAEMESEDLTVVANLLRAVERSLDKPVDAERGPA